MLGESCGGGKTSLNRCWAVEVKSLDCGFCCCRLAREAEHGFKQTDAELFAKVWRRFVAARGFARDVAKGLVEYMMLLR